MTQTELSLIIKGFRSVYNNPKFVSDQFAFSMWYALLKDLTYEEASAAAQIHMQSSVYEPKPADIRKNVHRITTQDNITGNEAWALVHKAIRNSAYHSDEEFNKLPELVKKAVGSPRNLKELAIADDFNQEVEKSHFLREYNKQIQKAEEVAQLSPKVRDLITGVTEQMRLGNGQVDNQEDNIKSIQELPFS